MKAKHLGLICSFEKNMEAPFRSKQKDILINVLNGKHCLKLNANCIIRQSYRQVVDHTLKI